MEFNSKETYLAAVAQWKANYKQLSKDIVQAKHAFKDADRNLQKAKYGTVERRDAWSILGKAESLVHSLKYQATSMIHERHQGKEEAQRQYLESISVK